MIILRFTHSIFFNLQVCADHQEVQERVQALQGYGDYYHEGRPQEVLAQGQGCPQQAEVQEGPDQGRPAQSRHHRQVPEASARQEGSQGAR